MAYDLLIRNGSVVDGSGLPRYRADIGVVDGRIAAIGRIREGAREVVHDLPTGSRRLVQRATGFAATVVNGQVLLRDGKHTGALPGRLLRGPLAARSRSLGSVSADRP
jgi:N-acyl-D-aspartate/D-glutamate deacylase